MATMKENKGREVMDKVTGQEVLPQPHLLVGDKRKNLSLGVDLGNLPSKCREKKPKHKSSKPKDVQSTLLVAMHEPVDVQILDDPELKDPLIHVPSTTKMSSSSKPS